MLILMKGERKMALETIDEKYYIKVKDLMKEQSDQRKRLLLSGITYRQYGEK